MLLSERYRNRGARLDGTLARFLSLINVGTMRHLQLGLRCFPTSAILSIAGAVVTGCAVESCKIGKKCTA